MRSQRAHAPSVLALAGQRAGPESQDRRSVAFPGPASGNVRPCASILTSDAAPVLPRRRPGTAPGDILDDVVLCGAVRSSAVRWDRVWGRAIIDREEAVC